MNDWKSGIARSQKMITDVNYKRLYSDAEKLSKMLSGFRNSLGEWKTVE